MMQCRLVARGCCKRLLTVGRLDDLVPFQVQIDLQRIQNRLIVVTNQNRVHAVSLFAFKLPLYHTKFVGKVKAFLSRFLYCSRIF